MKFVVILLICLYFKITLCSGYRIFAIFPVRGKSHFSVLEKVVKSLAEKGHQVDVVSGFPLEKPFPNYRDVIDIYKGSNLTKEPPAFDDYFQRAENSRKVHEICRKLCSVLENPELIELIKNPPNDPPYDLVLTQIYAGYQCFTAVAHMWNVPVVGILTSSIYTYNNHFIGNPLSLAIAPRNQRVHKENMTFWDRLYNVVMSHHVIYEFYSEAHKQQDLINKYLGPNVPHYTELEKSISMLLSNSHYSIHGIYPKTPALVEIGGIHIKDDDNSTMNPELRRILDESKDGFIYFSFGTIVIIEIFPKEIFEHLYAVFRKLAPIRIIMRSANPEALPKGMPDNVFTYPWLPQQKILQHPNIKGFVSHGGGLGTQEAVYYGVPIICIPFFADQITNCDIVVNKNIGLRLNIRTSERKDYEYAFNEILTNPKYKKSIQKLSTIYRDRPMKPKDQVVYWIEYVIRHGKNVLRSRAVDLKWWQNELLDVYAFILLCIVAAVFVIVLIAKKLINLILTMNKHFSIRHIRLSKKLN